MENSSLLKEDLVKMVQEAKKNSLVEKKVYVPGEVYVSKETKNRKIMDEKFKKGIAYIVASAAIIGSLTAGVTVVDTMYLATEIKEEVNDTYTAQDLIGGKYFEVYEHDQEFRDYANDLNSFELTGLFSETKEAMDNNGMVTNLDSVVDQMEENYVGKTGKSK